MVASAFLLVVFPGFARGAGPVSVAQRLADDTRRSRWCATRRTRPATPTAEQYQPTSVDTVLGNPTVTLDRAAPRRKGTQDTGRRPRSDIAGLGDDYYLNLNGDPLGDTCVYARDFAALKPRARRRWSPTPTSRASRAPRLRAPVLVLLVLQPVQRPARERLGGDAARLRRRPPPGRRSRQEPDEMILFQHAGGERADWDDTKVQKEGTHPVVYPAAGSHATFYELGGLRRERRARLRARLRQHERSRCASCARARSCCPTGPPDGPVRVAELRRALGPEGDGLQQRPDRPADQEAVEASRSPGWTSQRATSARLPAGSIVGPAVTRRSAARSPTVSDVHQRASTRSRSGRSSRWSSRSALIVAVRRPHPLAPGRSRARCGPARLRPADPRRAPALRSPLARRWFRSRSPRSRSSAGRSTCSPAVLGSGRDEVGGGRHLALGDLLNARHGRSRWRSSPAS